MSIELHAHDRVQGDSIPAVRVAVSVLTKRVCRQLTRRAPSLRGWSGQTVCATRAADSIPATREVLCRQAHAPAGRAAHVRPETRPHAAWSTDGACAVRRVVHARPELPSLLVVDRSL
jgi:hypothetical protein